jgi:RNA polymerase sigma factor (sigma-70 family)
MQDICYKILKEVEKNKAVISCATKIYKKYLEEEIILSCVYCGVWRTIKEYDVKFNTKFSTVLYNNILYECKTEIGKKNFKKNIDLNLNELMQNKEIYFNENDAINKLIIEEFLEGLSKRDRRIVINRFLNNETLEEIAKKEGLTREGVRYIINKIMPLANLK